MNISSEETGNTILNVLTIQFQSKKECTKNPSGDFPLIVHGNSFCLKHGSKRKEELLEFFKPNPFSFYQHSACQVIQLKILEKNFNS